MKPKPEVSLSLLQSQHTDLIIMVSISQHLHYLARSGDAEVSDSDVDQVSSKLLHHKQSSTHSVDSVCHHPRILMIISHPLHHVIQSIETSSCQHSSLSPAHQLC